LGMDRRIILKYFWRSRMGDMDWINLD